MTEQPGPSADGDDAAARARAVEWSVGVLSAALVLAMAGFLFFQAIANSDPRPVLSATPVRVEARGGVHRVEFTVDNRGGAAAAEVTAEGVLTRDGRAIESHSVAFDYVPAQAQRRGALYVRNDPDEYALTLAAGRYREPG